MKSYILNWQIIYPINWLVEDEGEPGSLARMNAKQLMEQPLRMFASFAPEVYKKMQPLLDELNARQDK